MTSARPTTLTAVAVVVAVVTFSGVRLWESRGGTGLPIPWLAVAAMLLIAAAVVAAGLPVRRWNAGDRRQPLDPLRAARVVVLAQACALSGAVLVGWYAGQALVLAGDLGVEPRRERLVVAVVAVGAAAVVAVAGLVVQHWCRLPPDDDDSADGDEDDEG